jgi:hypothetical protein
VGTDMRVTEARAQAPAEVLANADFVLAIVRGVSAEHRGWSTPVQIYFRRAGGQWELVGLDRSGRDIPPVATESFEH